MADGRVPVRGAVRAAFDFWRYSVGRTAGVLTAVVLANLAWEALGPSPLGLFAGLVAVLIGFMANGALLRLAFADEHPADPAFRIGPSGFQWARAEMRLLGAFLLVMFLFVLGLLFLFVISFVWSGAALLAGHAAINPVDPGALPPNLKRTVAILADVYCLICIWVGVRISLYPAAIVAERRLMVFSTWGLTKGQFWRILAALVLVMLPAMALTLVLATVPMPRSLALGLSLLITLVNAFLEAPLVFGLLSYLYRGLRPATAATFDQVPAGRGAGPWSSTT